MVGTETCPIPRLAGRPNTDRNRLKRREPLWPVTSLTPSSRCPHGVRIGNGRVCGVCHAAARLTEEQIDALPAEPIENPEDRASKQIAFYRQYLWDHPELTTKMKIHIVRQIAKQERILREYLPTKYRPRSLRGGLG